MLENLLNAIFNLNMAFIRLWILLMMILYIGAFAVLAIGLVWALAHAFF